MAHTALHQRPGSVYARTGLYNGAETIAAFGDPLAELQQLTSACGVFELAWRAKLTARGRDRIRWLNGMVTNTIKDLPVNRGGYSFVLNPQGRILGDLYVYNRGDYLLLDTDRSQLENLMNTLKRFIIMDQVELAATGESLSAIGVCGPQANQIMASAGIHSSDLQPLEVRELTVDNVTVSLVRGPEQKPGWYEIWAGEENVAEIWER